METDRGYRAKYQAAFDSFLEKVKKDDTIIAAYLFGSLVRGDVWEKSDLDVMLVTNDERRQDRSLALVEEGITFHCDVYSRSSFRRIHERFLRGSAGHHVFTSGKLVYTLDESLEDFFKDVAYVGERDRQLLAMRYGFEVIALMHDVEKALVARQDPLYAFIWLLEAVRALAGVEVVMSGGIVGRELLHQALALNPGVFEELISFLMQGKRDLTTLHHLLSSVDGYLAARATLIFQPLLDYLVEQKEVRGASEIFRQFENRLQMQSGDIRLIGCCDWLAEKGFIEKVSSQVRLTMKSRVFVDEPAYYYSGEKENA